VSHQKRKKVTITAQANVQAKSLQHYGSSKLRVPENTALAQQDIKGRHHRVISVLLVIAIISIPMILIMIVIYIVSSIFFP
jgi:hypothetical protein